MIVRHPHETSYTVIQNETLNDERLSWKARGLLSYLLSKPDGWRVIVEALIKEAPDGRDAVNSGLRELEKFGYLVRSRTRGGNGQFDGNDTEIHERPQCSENPQVETTNGKPSCGSPTNGKSATSKDLFQEVMIEEESFAHTECEPLTGFNEFWGTYPRRNGRIIGKEKCQTRWKKYSLGTRRAAWRGAKNYAMDCDSGLTIAKDPDRWLRDRSWEDWQEPTVNTKEATKVTQEVPFDPDAPNYLYA
jgi:hypothetical protein